MHLQSCTKQQPEFVRVGVRTNAMIYMCVYISAYRFAGLFQGLEWWGLFVLNYERIPKITSTNRKVWCLSLDSLKMFLDSHDFPIF